MSERAVFSLLTLLLVGYCVLEIARVRRVHADRWLLNPVVIASVLIFCLGFGVGNLLFFLPAEGIELVGLVPDVTPAMVKLMWLALAGAMGMWLGYWSTIATRLGGRSAQRVAARWFRRDDRPRKLALPLLVTVGLVATLAQIALGVFGYSSSYDRLIEMGSVTQYLSMGASLGPAALVVASLDFFSDRPSKRARLWFVVILAIEISFGVLSGFKSQMAMPFVIAGACKYLHTGRLPRAWLVGFLVAVLSAYAVIEPFRAAKNEDRVFEGTSIGSIVDTFIASRGRHDAVDDRSSVWVALLARSTLTHVGSLGVSFRDEHDELPEGSPEFLANLLLAPAYAFIPRSIWRSKPVGDLGLWYTQVVLGRNMASATAMSPVTYLYFAGGAVAVFVGFLCFGVLYRLLVVLVRPDQGAGRALVYLVMLPDLANISSSVDGVAVFVFRMLPLVLLLQYLVYPPQRRQQARPLPRPLPVRPRPR